jgi:Ser/Thr protein kinase RdoA (MazF antagonist)
MDKVRMTPNTHDTLQTSPPDFAVSELAAVVEQQFGLVGDYRPLVSERDQNFHLMITKGDEYVVKVTSSTEPEIVSDFQIAALLHLETSQSGVPRVIRTRDGKTAGTISTGDYTYKLRVMSFLPGELLSSVALTRDLAVDFGARLAQLHGGLETFSHPGENPLLLWDLQRAGELRGLLSNIDDSTARRAVERALDDFESIVVPGLGELRKQVIHGDANPGNVLVDPGTYRVTGFIDFGDMVRAPLIFDVAIAAAYLRGPDEDPLRWIRPFVAGYRDAAPLPTKECSLLFDLVRARLATTITLLFWRMGARCEDDPYREKTLREESGAIRFLAALDAIGRKGFTAQLEQTA